MSNIEGWVFSTHPPTLGEMVDMQQAQQGDLRALLRWVASRYQRSYKECRKLAMPDLLMLMTQATERLTQEAKNQHVQEAQERADLERQLDVWSKQMKEPPEDRGGIR